MTFRNRDYLAFVRAQACCVTFSTYGVVAAHVRIGGDGGMGLKPSDYRAVPLTELEHRRQHAVGERTFWRDAGVDPLRVMRDLMFRYAREKFGVILGDTASSEPARQVDELVRAVEALRNL